MNDQGIDTVDAEKDAIDMEAVLLETFLEHFGESVIYVTEK